MKNKVIKIVSVITVLFALSIGLFHNGSNSITNKAQAATSPIIITNNPQLSTDGRPTYTQRMIMQDYPLSSWAKRFNNTAGASRLPGHSGYTEMQILPDTKSLANQCNGDQFPSLINQTGNKFTQEGTLSDRFQAGGPGMFLGPDSYGGWADRNFSPEILGWKPAVVKTNYLATNLWKDYPLIGSDQIGYINEGDMDSFKDNYTATGFENTLCYYQRSDPTLTDQSMWGKSYGTSVLGNILIGGETVLFVRKFNLTADEYAKLATTGPAAYFEGLADEFSKAYINGVRITDENTIASEKPIPQMLKEEDRRFGYPDGVSNADGKPDIPLSIADYHFQVGENTLAIQVTNKMHWEVRKEGVVFDYAKFIRENPLSLYYKLFIGQKTPDPLGCSVEPQKGLAPLAVKVTASGGVPPYDFNMESGITLPDRTSPVYYTYGTAIPNQKNITVTDHSSPPKTCPVSVTINPATSGSGGEVAP